MYTLKSLRQAAAYAEDLRADVRGDTEDADPVALNLAEGAIESIKAALGRGPHGQCGAGTECIRLVNDIGRTEKALELFEAGRMHDEHVTKEYLVRMLKARTTKFDAMLAGFEKKMAAIGVEVDKESAKAMESLPNV